MMGRLPGCARPLPLVPRTSTATTTSRRRRRPPGGDPTLRLQMLLLLPPFEAPRRYKHTSQWMQRHVRDPYVRAAKRDDLRSRAAFKLMEMQDKCRIIRPGHCVVDIGCAPGGWSEVAAGLVNKKGTKRQQGRVVGIDLLLVQPPVAGATLLQGDFTDPKCRAELLRLATAPMAAVVEGEGKGRQPVRVDVVLSDVAPNFSGDAYTDHVRTLQLCYEVFDFAAEAFSLSLPVPSLGPVPAGPEGSAAATAAAAAAAGTAGSAPAGRGGGGRINKGTEAGGGHGAVLCKFFQGRDEKRFLSHVRASYAEVRLLKPKASRSESSETYVLARGFRPPAATDVEEKEEADGVSGGSGQQGAG